MKKAQSQFAQWLRYQRFHHNWSQQELADRLDTTVVTISRWENGVSTPSPCFRLKLAQIFGNHINEILRDRQEKEASAHSSQFQYIDTEKTTEQPSLVQANQACADTVRQTQPPVYQQKEPAVFQNKHYPPQTKVNAWLQEIITASTNAFCNRPRFGGQIRKS